MSHFNNTPNRSNDEKSNIAADTLAAGGAVGGTLAAIGGGVGALIGGGTVTTTTSVLGIPILTTVVAATTPVWAVPVAITGGVVAIGSIAYLAYEKLTSE